MTTASGWRQSLLNAVQALLTLDIASSFITHGWELTVAGVSLRSPGLLFSGSLLATLLVVRTLGRENLGSYAVRSRSRAWQCRWELSLAALLVPGAALRFWGLDFGLPLMAHPDEADAVSPALFMIQRGTWDPDWYIYPTAYLYLILPFLALHCLSLRGNGLVPTIESISRFEPGLYIAARSVSATLGTLTILPLYRAATTFWSGERGKRVGLVAAALVTFSFLHIRESHHAVTDVLLVFLLTAALVPVARILQRDHELDYALAGFLSGLAGATKYSALPMVAVLVTAHLLGDALRDG